MSNLLSSFVYFFRPTDLNKVRGFFCIAKLDGEHMAIGGYSGKIEKSMEAVWSKSKKLPDMNVAR